MPVPRLVDQVVTVINGLTFVSTSKHRVRGNPNGSIWSISYRDEYICFLKSKPHKHSNGISWGAHIVGGSLNVLGTNSSGTIDLRIAKFTNHNNNNNLWHGYPTDPRIKTTDIPSDDFLRFLVSNNYLTKAKSRKLVNGNWK